MTLIEMLVVGEVPSLEMIAYELHEICDREHSGCNGECPVYRLNGGCVGANKPFSENRGCDCFKDGYAMYNFINEKYQETNHAG